MGLRRHNTISTLVALVAVFSLNCEGADSGGVGESDLARLAPAAPDAILFEEPRLEASGVVFDEPQGLLILDPLVGPPLNHFPHGEIYGGLTRFDGSISGGVDPDLARSWTVGDDGRSYVFRLRDGLRFSDGSRLTAADVKWSWERALHPVYLTADARETFGAIAGASEMMTGTANALRGVVAVDEETLAVQLVRRQAHFLEMLARPAASALSQENFLKWGTMNWTRAEENLWRGFDEGELVFDELPVGTGPFRVVAADYLEEILLEPNPHYHRASPRARNIRFRRFTPQGPEGYQSQALQPGERGDVRKWSPASLIDRALRRGEPESTFAETELVVHMSEEELLDLPQAVEFRRAAEVTWMAFNSAVAPFDDVEFRRALMKSLRRPGNHDVRHLGEPTGRATALIPDGASGRRALVEAAANEGAARSHLLSSKYASGDIPTTLEFHANAGQPGTDYFSRLSVYWNAWLMLRITDTSPDLDRSILNFARSLDRGTLQMQYVHVKPQYPDPCAVLCRVPDLFGPNAQSVETAELREMLHDAAATPDRAERIVKYQAIEEHILDRALVVPISWDDGVEQLQIEPYISGYKLPAYGGSRYEDVVVDTTHPEYPRDRISGG